MNYLVLQPGEAIYVPADGLHAYLSGDIVECMARSNNVLNTGFCPRAQRDDVDVFVESLSFQPGDEKGSKKGEEALLVSRQDEKGRMGRTRVYSPPLGEFDMLVTRLGVGQREVVSAVEGPSVLFVTEGKGRMRAKSGGEGGEGGEWDVKEGYVFFVGKGVELSFDTEESGEGLVVYRAFAE